MATVTIKGKTGDLVATLRKAYDLAQTDAAVPWHLRQSIARMIEDPERLVMISGAMLRGDALVVTVGPSAELASAIAELGRLRAAA